MSAGTIPDDIFATARTIADEEVNFGSYEVNVLAIARAILAERERCAKACEFRAAALARIPGYRSEVNELRARATFIRSGA
ncbi:hypothetical protein [Mesorhizobium sp.]|uniref:hypothetical protein n=1 Tax=Mesorhizobium sp. TaxID=1871066 RepID=UPI00267F99FC